MEVSKFSSKCHRYFFNEQERVHNPIVLRVIDNLWTSNNSRVLKACFRAGNSLEIETNFGSSQDLRKSQLGVGDFKLSKTRPHFSMSWTKCVCKSNKEMDRLYNGFRLHLTTKRLYITLNDSSSTIYIKEKWDKYKEKNFVEVSVYRNPSYTSTHTHVDGK